MSSYDEIANSGPDARTIEIVECLIHQAPKMFERKIQQVLFVADQYSHDRFGERLLDVCWKPTMYGFYSEEVHESMEECRAESRPMISNLHGSKSIERVYYGSPSTSVHGDDLVSIINAIDLMDDMTTREVIEHIKRTDIYSRTDTDDCVDF